MTVVTLPRRHAAYRIGQRVVGVYRPEIGDPYDVSGVICGFAPGAVSIESGRRIMSIRSEDILSSPDGGGGGRKAALR